MNELAQYAQLIIDFLKERGASLNIASQQALGTMLQQILQVIQQEEPQGAPLLPPQGPDIEPAMPSSNVEGFAYNPKQNQLFVRFLGKYPNRNGPIYSYQGVPPVMFELFKRGSAAARTDGRNKWGQWWKGKSPSMGASVYTLLRLGGFP